MQANLTGHRSYSQVSQLRRCSYQYKLQRLDKVPSRPMVNAVAGVAVHVGTETVDHNLPPSKGGVETARLAHGLVLEAATNAALAALDSEVEKYEAQGWPVADWISYPRQSFDWFRDTGIPNSIQAYLDWRINNPDFELAEIEGFGPAIEVPFNYYVGAPCDLHRTVAGSAQLHCRSCSQQLIHGWIDRVFTSRERGGYYPMDLKSGKKPATDEQLGLYARALSALGWDVTWGYYLYMLKSGTAKQTPPLRLDHWDDENLSQVYLPATRQIEQGIFVPNPGENCQHCGVSDACPFAQSVV